MFELGAVLALVVGFLAAVGLALAGLVRLGLSLLALPFKLATSLVASAMTMLGQVSHPVVTAVLAALLVAVLLVLPVLAGLGMAGGALLAWQRRHQR